MVAQVRLLGRFDLRIGGQGVSPLASARAESVLALLLLDGGWAISRRHVASMLWPESSEAQARTNLRHVVHTLRQGLPGLERYVQITPQTLRWRPEAPVELDVEVFERLVAGDAGTDDLEAGRRMQQLRDALARYRGDLLEGCDDEWLLEARDRLRRRFHDALAELVRLCEERGALVEGIEQAERLLRSDPLREETYQRLMRMYDASGDRARAVRTYHVCSSTLERELEVEPSSATRATYEALLPAQGDTDHEPSVQAGGRLVGRRPERARLADLWRSAEGGLGRLVLVYGEPGVGKSRLAEELAAWCTHRGSRVADARCYPAEGPLAFGPVAAWLRSDALHAVLRQLDRTHVTEIARLLPELLADRPDAARPAPLPEAEQRHRLFDAVAAAVLAGDRPTLLVLDDVQHVDRETCRLLHYLLRARPRVRVLVLATARREDLEPGHPALGLLVDLRTRDRLEEIDLARLDRADTTMLAGRVVGAPLGAVEAEALFDETEGNPLFVIEALRAGWTSERPLSPRVQSVIEARLNRLSEPARDLAALAATIGRGFDVDVLRAASDTDDAALVRGLDELWRRRIVRERRGDGAGGGSYDFSHGKIRQVAADGTAPARRRRLHHRIAIALERVYATEIDPVSAQIAVHHEQAGATGPAVAWYRRAARAAQLLHAHHDAVRLLDRGLALLASVPASASCDASELELCTDRLVPLVELAGYASPEMISTQERALALTDARGLDPSPPLLRSVALSALTRADFPAATRFGSRLQEAAKRSDDPVLDVEASYVLGIASFWQAELPSARRHFERAVEWYRPEDRLTHLVHYAQDPKVVCLGRLANTLWFLGRPDAARRTAAAALAWAAEIDHPFSSIIGHTFAALLALDMGDDTAVREHAAGLASAQDQTVNRHVAEAFGGYVAVLDGAGDAGVQLVRAAVASTGPVGAAPGQQALLVRVLLAACVAAGDRAGARGAADRLLAMGGPARLWAPVARAVREELATRS